MWYFRITKYNDYTNEMGPYPTRKDAQDAIDRLQAALGKATMWLYEFYGPYFKEEKEDEYFA